MKLLIGGDVVPTANNIMYFENGKIENLLSKKLIKKMNNYDFRIINLECPLYENNNPISKSGPVLYSSSKCINGLISMNVNLVCLANNHTFDEGIVGLEQTINLLNNANIINIGAGRREYKKNYYILPNTKVAIYNCCECEFNYSKGNKYCANIFDYIDTYNEIKELKEKEYLIIILYHGGKEYYKYPSPNLQKICRNFINLGASTVICQHSHCVGTYEKYLNGIILYGQGNFIFNRIKNEMNQKNLLVEINIENNKIIETKFIPIEYDENDIIDLMPEKKGKEFLNKIDFESNKILSSEFINKEYIDFSKKNLDNYISQLNGEKIEKIIYKKIKKNKVYSEKDLNNILNILQCDAHRELLITALRNIENKDRKDN